MSPERIAKLRRLLAESTPGRWAVEGPSRDSVWCEGEWIADCYEDDAALIAAAINTLPSLLDAAEERDRLRDQIERGGCAAAREGETTFECDATRPCGLCRLRNDRDRLREEIRKIHEACKRGAATEDHGTIGNLRCILDHVCDVDLPDPFDAAEERDRARATLAAIRDRLDRCACEGACAVAGEVRELIDREVGE